MTEADIEYIEMLLRAGAINGPVLELGGGYGGKTCRELVENSNIAYESTDLAAGEGVDHVADFSSASSIKDTFGEKKYGTVLVLNVLEHTFDPICILDNALSLVGKAGFAVLITPAVWPIHHYPIDCCRLLPNWYQEYARTRDCILIEEYFYYVGIGKIAGFTDISGKLVLPSPAPGKPYKTLRSRIVHKLFNTYGRGVAFPTHVAIGAVFQKSNK